MVWITNPPWDFPTAWCPACATHHYPGACVRRGWSYPMYPESPQPWECPRCHKMHGPASLTCSCAPITGADGAGE